MVALEKKTAGVSPWSAWREAPPFGGLVEDEVARAREAIVDLSSGTVASLIFFGKTIRVTTYQRLSCENVQRIREKLIGVAARAEAVSSFGEDLAVEINGISDKRYKFAGESRRFGPETTFPLLLNRAPFGALFVEALDTGQELRLRQMLDALEADFAHGLRALWESYRRHKEQLQSFVSATLDGVIFCTTDNRIQFINQRALRLLGASSRRLWAGLPLAELNAAYVLEFLREARENGLSEMNRVAELEKKRSRAFIGLHIELLKDSRYREIGWLVVLRDITTSWLNDRIRQALAVASHEVKTPLSSINGVVDLLIHQEIGTLNAKQQRCLTIVRDDINRLHRLLDTTLDFSRFERGVPYEDRRKETSLHMLVDKVSTLLQPFAQMKRIQIENGIAPAIPAVRGDRDLLQQVLYNLVENSIKYSLPESVVRIKAMLTKHHVCVQVSDEGVGIPAHEVRNIFQRFKQLDNSPEHGCRGQGLGLSIAKEIVNQAGGEIWVESKLGAGSTFYFTIPVGK